MVAIAEAMGGDVEGACRTIRRMHWNGQRGPALASIAKLAADNPEALLLIAAEMETLIGGEKVTLYEDGLIAVLNSLEPFVRNTPEQAERLLDNAWTSIGGMSNRWMVCRCAQAEINARAKLNRDVAVAHLELLLNWLESPPQRPSIGAAELNSIISAANALATGDTRWAATIEARARALLKSITAVGEGGDSSELIGLTAVVNPVRAAIELTRQVGSIRELAKAGPSSIENFRRMVSELTGARYSPRNRQIDAITQAAGSVVQLDQIDTDAAESILDHLIEVTTTNLSGDDLGDALQSVIRMLGAREARLLGLFAERIAAVAAGMHDSEDSANRVRHALASTLGETGHLGLADRVVADMPPGDLHDDAATLVEAFRELKALGELSPLEQDFLLGDDSNLKRITVILLRKETKPGELLHAAANAVIERAAMLDRIKIMGTFAPIMLLPAYSNGGPKLMNMIVDGVEGWDHRFEEAARLIGDVA